MGSKSRKAKLRQHRIPDAAAATGQKLMDDQAAATKRYNDWGVDTVAAMNIGEPREGHIWVIDPKAKLVNEVPGRPRR